jgi:hypothetical protein
MIQFRRISFPYSRQKVNRQLIFAGIFAAILLLNTSMHGESTTDATLSTVSTYHKNFYFDYLDDAELSQSVSLDLHTTVNKKNRRYSLGFRPTFVRYFYDDRYDPATGDTSSLNGFERLGHISLAMDAGYSQPIGTEANTLSLDLESTYTPNSQFLSSDPLAIIPDDTDSSVDLLTLSAGIGTGYEISRRKRVQGKTHYDYTRDFYINPVGDAFDSLPTQQSHTLSTNLLWEAVPRKYFLGPSFIGSFALNQYAEEEAIEENSPGSRHLQGGIQQRWIFLRALITTLTLGGTLNQTLVENLPAENSFVFTGSANARAPFLNDLFLGTLNLSHSNRSTSGLVGVYQVQEVGADVSINVERIALISKRIRVFPHFSANYTRSKLDDTSDIPLFQAGASLFFPFSEDLGVFANYTFTRQEEALVDNTNYDPISATSISLGISYHFDVLGSRKSMLHRLPRVL